MSVKITKVDTMPEIDPYHRDTNGWTLTCLTIDPSDETAYVDQEYDDNATPEPVWNGRIVEVTLHGLLDGGQIEAYLNSEEGQNLLQRVCDGHEIEWNGSNHVGYKNEDAQAALDELVEELETCAYEGEAWVCEDWFGNLTDSELGISKDMTHEDVVSLAKRYRAEAEPTYLIDSVSGYLAKRIKEMEDEE